MGRPWGSVGSPWGSLAVKSCAQASILMFIIAHLNWCPHGGEACRADASGLTVTVQGLLNPPNLTEMRFLVKKAHFSHSCWSEGYTLYETLIEMCIFWLK